MPRAGGGRVHLGHEGGLATGIPSGHDGGQIVGGRYQQTLEQLQLAQGLAGERPGRRNPPRLRRPDRWPGRRPRWESCGPDWPSAQGVIPQEDQGRHHLGQAGDGNGRRRPGLPDRPETPYGYRRLDRGRPGQARDRSDHRRSRPERRFADTVAAPGGAAGRRRTPPPPPRPRRRPGTPGAPCGAAAAAGATGGGLAGC